MEEVQNNSAQNIQLSEGEQNMQKFLFETYGITKEEFDSIVLWLDNFSLKLDNKERFEKNEDALCRDFNLNANDIFDILFSHGDVFCTDYPKTQEDYEFLHQRYGATKSDFASMLKKGCVVDKSQVIGIEKGLREMFPDRKFIPILSIINNVIEYPNLDYVADIAYKIELLGKFGISFNDINGKLYFLMQTAPELLTRLKLMNLTNELATSFLNVGHKISSAKAYKTFLKHRADWLLNRKGYSKEFINLKSRSEAVDETQPLSEEQIKDINYSFEIRFPLMHKLLMEINVPVSKKMPEFQVGPANFQPIEESQSKKVKLLSGSEASKDAVESGKQVSFIKNTGQVKFQKSKQTAVNGNSEFVNLDPAYKRVWTYMVKNFGLKYAEYPEVVELLKGGRRNRLMEQTDEIAALYKDVSQDYGVSKKDFGQFFKYTLYGMPQRLSLLECFGIGVQELAANNYENAAVLGLGYDQLEYMLKVASIGNVNLKENLWRLARFKKDTFLAKYIKYYEEGANVSSMLDLPLLDREYQEIVYQKVPQYKSNHVIEDRFAESFPIVSSFLEGYNENQRNLLMMVGLLIKKYGMSYTEAKTTVTNSPKNFNEHSKIIQERINALEKLGFETLEVIYNSSILRLPEEKSMPRAIIAQYLGIDEETFLKHYYSASEAKVFARMMGASDIKPSYYYASEKVFNEITGLSTEDLMKVHKITIGQLSKLKKEIYERESKEQIKAVLAKGLENEKQVFDSESNLPTAYSQEEIKFREYMSKNYGIDAFEFNNKRNIIGAKGLKFLTVEQMEDVLSILKREFEIVENEDITRIFKNNPVLFTNGFSQFVSRYNYFENNFDVSRNMYAKMLMYSEPSVLLRDDLLDTYLKLKETLQNEYGVELTESDFVTIVRHFNGINNSNIYSFVTRVFKILKAYQIDPSEIKSRYEFMVIDDLRSLETRLMLMPLLDETPNNYFSYGCYIKPYVLIERYFLYKQGKISEKALWMRKNQFDRVTGIEIDPEGHISSKMRIEVIRDFAKKVGNVSFAPSDEIFEKKLAQQGKDEVIIRNNDFLNYMLGQILGANYEVVRLARARGTRFADVYARFMAVDKFMDSPNKYYASETFWRKTTGTSTPELKERFSIDEDTAEIIKRAYFEKFPEEAFGIDGEFTRKVKKLGTVEKQKDS